MARILRVFVTYSRHDQEVERVTALIAWLTELSDHKIEFVFDSRLRASESVRDFEKSISQYPSVLVIGTKRYKEKVLQPDFGVSREHDIIVSLLKRQAIKVFLAVMEQSLTEVFPEDLHAPLASDFVGLIHDPRTKNLSAQTKTTFHNAAYSLISDILSLSSSKVNRQPDIAEIRRRLFFEPKQEVMSAVLPDEIFNKIFVKTSFYYAVTERNAYLLIGRKGSGKSFLTEYFTRNPREESEISIGVHLRDYKLSTIYAMRSALRIEADIDKVLSQRDIFEVAWALFFVSAALLTIYVKIRNGALDYSPHRLSEVAAFAEKCKCLTGPNADGESGVAYRPLIDWCIEKVFHFIDTRINAMSGEYAAAISDLPSFVDPTRAVPAIIGLPALRQFEAAVNQLSPTFLITVDGFDTKFDNFRRDTNVVAFDEKERTRRIKFEIDWLCGLIEATSQLVNRLPTASIPSVDGAAFRFLVTLPRDRFSEVLKVDRDAYRLRYRQVEIRWTGIELMNLVRKRLEIFFDQECAERDIHGRLLEALDFMGSVPHELRFSFNGGSVTIDTFCYMLRHTFWRPRDILYHVAELVSLSQKYRKFKRPITVESIRDIVKPASASIIRDEFIGEFESIFPKIDECIRAFMRSKIEMDYAELFRIISRVEFRLSSGEMVERPNERIEFLYELGFLGVVPSDEVRQRLRLPRRESFSFSTSLDVRQDLDAENIQTSRWVIHPIFAEYLQLDCSNAPFLQNYNPEDLLKDD